jgi:hypothetical protein
MGYGLDGRGSIPSRINGGIFFPFAIASRLALRPTQSPVQWVQGALSPGVYRVGTKLTAHINVVPRLRMRGAIPPLLQYVFLAWCLPLPLPLP